MNRFAFLLAFIGCSIGFAREAYGFCRATTCTCKSDSEEACNRECPKDEHKCKTTGTPIAWAGGCVGYSPSLAGTSQLTDDEWNGDFALARYNPDGSLDATFGANGKVTTDFGGDTNIAFDLGIQKDGKIVAAGYVRTGDNEDTELPFAGDAGLTDGAGIGATQDAKTNKITSNNAANLCISTSQFW